MRLRVKFQLWAPLRKWITALDAPTRQRVLRAIMERTVALYGQSNGERHACKHPRSVRFDMDDRDPLFLAWDHMEYTTRVALLNIVAREMRGEYDKTWEIVAREMRGEYDKTWEIVAREGRI